MVLTNGVLEENHKKISKLWEHIYQKSEILIHN